VPNYNRLQISSKNHQDHIGRHRILRPVFEACLFRFRNTYLVKPRMDAYCPAGFPGALDKTCKDRPLACPGPEI
jgi:hypothetical protein